MNGKEKVKEETAEQENLRSLLADIGREGSLPKGDTELILLEIDPHRAHVCWNIDPGQAISPNPLVLRVFDITEGGSVETANQSFDVEVFGLQGRWYLDLWRDDRTFVSQIGYLNPDGSLRVLAQSNSVKTPPAEPTLKNGNGNHVDHKGEPLHTEWPGDVNPPAVEAEYPAAKPAPETPPMKIEPVTLLESVFPETEWTSIPTDTVSHQENKIEPEKVSDQLSRESVQAAGEASVAFAEEVMSGIEKEFPSPDLLSASVENNNPAIQAYYDAVGQAGSVEHAPENAASHGSPAEGKAPEAPAPYTSAPLEQIVGLSSNEHTGRDVLLEVHAELHIYGRSKPNTELTLYGQIVKTRPDGSFSVRRPLPHGAVILPLLYTKKGDGHQEV